MRWDVVVLTAVVAGVGVGAAGVGQGVAGVRLKLNGKVVQVWSLEAFRHTCVITMSHRNVNRTSA